MQSLMYCLQTSSTDDVLIGSINAVKSRKCGLFRVMVALKGWWEGTRGFRDHAGGGMHQPSREDRKRGTGMEGGREGEREGGRKREVHSSVNNDWSTVIA